MNEEYIYNPHDHLYFQVMWSKICILGIYFTDKMSMSKHIQHTVSVCNQRLYLLCQLKKQNLPVECLDRIVEATVIPKLMYASPS